MLLNCGVEDSWESLDCKEIQPVHPKGDQSWVFIGRTDVEAETPILWPPDAIGWLIWEDPDAGKDWGQEENGTKEDEMVGWHHQHNGHGFGWTLGIGDGQGGLVCCSSWGHKESDTTELNWTELSSCLNKNVAERSVLEFHKAASRIDLNTILISKKLLNVVNVNLKYIHTILTNIHVKF